MVSVKPYFDTRFQRKDGTYPLKLAVSHKRKVALISLQIYLREVLQRVLKQIDEK